MSMRFLLLLGCSLGSLFSLSAQEKKDVYDETHALLGDRQAAFILRKSVTTTDRETEKGGILKFSITTSTSISTDFCYNQQRINERFPACSTYKIPHTLIALEENILSSPDQIVKWDAGRFSIDADIGEELRKKWAQDMNLKQAFKTSCVWFYQDIARQLPPKKVKGYLDRFEYGNRDNSGKRDRYWLGDGNTLKISAKEQVDFLQKLDRRKFDLKPETYDQAEQVFQTEDTPRYTLYAKTGTGKLPSGRYIGWYVGYIVKKEAEAAKKGETTTYYFAFNMDGTDMDDIAQNRLTIAHALLKLHGALD